MPKLFVIDGKIDAVPADADYILNLSHYEIEDSRVVDYKTEFRQILEETKQTYLEFVNQFGEATGFKKIKLAETSLWWFSEIQRKDTWTDHFFADLTAIHFIEYLQKDLKIDSIDFYRRDSFVARHFDPGATKPRTSHASCVTRVLIRRTKEFVKVILAKILIPRVPGNRNIRHLFFSFFPGNWNFDRDVFGDRVFRNMPLKLKDSAYVLYINKIERTLFQKIPDNSIVIQSYIGLWFLLKRYLDLRPFLWFMLNKKRIERQCLYGSIDVWPVYSEYIFKTVLANDFYYAVFMHGLKQCIKEAGPRDLISAGEFGLDAKAVSAACYGSETESIWYQHATFNSDKLYYVNNESEVNPDRRCNDQGPSDTYRAYMPLSNRLLVWSEHYRDLIVNCGKYPGNCCRIAETLRYSGFIKYKKSNIGKRHAENTIMFAPSVYETDIYRFCFFIQELIKKEVLKREQICLKLHPVSHKYFDLKKIFSEFDMQGINFIHEVCGIEKYADSISCLIAGGTTVGMEAAYFGISVIQYIPKYELNTSPFDESTATCFSDIHTLIQALRNLDKVKPIDYHMFFAEPNEENRLFCEAIIGEK